MNKKKITSLTLIMVELNELTLFAFFCFAVVVNFELTF